VLLTIGSQTRASQAVALVDAVLETIDQLATEPVTEVELARMRARFALELAAELDSPSSAAYWYGLERLYPSADSLRRRHQRAMAVTPDEIQRAVLTHLDRQHAQLTVVGDLDPIERATLRRRLHTKARAAVVSSARDPL